MIFYFSGTGNSEYVAQYISRSLEEDCVFIPNVLHEDTSYELSKGERLGFVFPVYSWGVPSFMASFIQKLKISGVTYVYYVCTCGDDTGKTNEQMESLLKNKGWKLSLGYSVKMPNTYVCLPGFDVDGSELESAKLNNASIKLEEVLSHLNSYDKGCFDTLPGIFPWLKSKVIRPFFNKYLITAKPFYSTDNCLHCGKCELECPMNNIKICEDTLKPQWGDNCVGCLRCYHFCPSNSIQFGSFTKGKGQYRYKK